MEKTLMTMKIIILTLILCLIAGCAIFPVEVSSISSDFAAANKNYILLPTKEGVDENSLLFQEYATYIHRLLKEKGFNQAKPEAADLVVFVIYGIGKPQTHYYSYSSPIYGTSSFSGTIIGPGGFSNFHGTSRGVVGSQTHSGSYTLYSQYLILDAYDAEKLRESGGENIVQLWKTTVIGEGSSNDLRRVMPVLVGAAYEYIGTDTKKRIKFILTENDKRVRLVKGLSNSKEIRKQ